MLESIEMPVFISYSHRDKAAYTMLCFALKSQHIEYWNTKTMRVGASLSAELREGIRKCEVCVFLATRHSIDSAWCSAELGAFWGAGIRVLVFITDPNLSEDHIPPQFKGDLWTPDVEEILRDVKAEISAAAERRLALSKAKDSEVTDKPGEVAKKPRFVSDMTIEMFYEVIRALHPNEDRPLLETMILLREAFVEGNMNFLDGTEALFESEADAQAFATPLLNSLVGNPVDQIASLGERLWKHVLTLTTNTGTWLGLAMFAHATESVWFENCLLIHSDKKLCDAAVLVGHVSGKNGIEGDSIIASSGTVTLGRVRKIQ